MSAGGARRLAVSLGAAAVLVTALTLGLGAIGLAAGGAIAMLGIAWRHDTATGTCLPLAVLALIAMAVMIALFALLMISAPR